MDNKIKKIALLTGGGDCPGLNAVIRAITRAAILIRIRIFWLLVLVAAVRLIYLGILL